MVEQPIEVGRRARKFLPPLFAENRREPALANRRTMQPLVQEQTEFGDETDIGERQRVADQEGAVRLQGLVDACGVDLEGLCGASVDVGGKLRIAQSEEVDLRIAGKYQAG